MAVRRTGGGLPNLQSQDARAQDKKADQKQDKKSSEFNYLRPRQLNTDAERRAAQQRKHAAELDDEAVKHMHIDDDSQQVKKEEEIEKEVKLHGINLDEERKKRGQRDGGEDDPDQKDIEDEVAKQLGQDSGYGKYFEDQPEDRMGDPSLINPNEIKRKLGPSARFAQHAMLIADQRMKEGMPREEALEFLCKLYLGLADRNYARKALKSFGPATGILDLYPLELTETLLKDVPSFLPKISVGRFLSKPPKKGYEAKTGEEITLTYSPELRIRGFAVKGGLKPGYLFEPSDPDGSYGLTFATPGEFTIMLSAMDRRGQVVIEELHFQITQGKEEEEEALESREAMQRYKSNIEEPPEEEEKKSEKKDDLKVVIPRYI